MKVSKSFLHASVCVFVGAKVLVTAGISASTSPPPTHSSGVSHTGLPTVGACMFGGSYSGVGTHSGGVGRSLTVSE